MTQLRKIYETIKSKNPNLDDERARQQAWVIRDRMIFENTAAAAGAGAGGAGGGGGGGARRRLLQQIQITTGQSYLVSWVDTSSDTWRIVVFNYSTDTLSETINTELTSELGKKWQLYNDPISIQDKGFTVIFQNGYSKVISPPMIKIYFIDYDGKIINIKELESITDFVGSEARTTILGTLNGKSVIYNFDGEKVNTFEFDFTNSIYDLTTEDISISNSNYYIDSPEVTKNGTIFIEAPTARGGKFGSRPGNYYLGLSTGELVDVTQLFTDFSENIIGYNNNFISTIKSESGLSIISEKGILLNSLTISEPSYRGNFYGENSLFYLLEDKMSYNRLVSYDGDTNEFTSVTFSTSEIQKTYYQTKSWIRPTSSFNKSLVLLSMSGEGTTEQLNIFLTGAELTIFWKNKKNNEFLNHFIADTLRVVDTSSNFNLTNGENPMILFVTASNQVPIIFTNEIQVGFLTDSGFITQSTGVSYNNQEGIIAGKISDKSFIGFKVSSKEVLPKGNLKDSKIIWQIYDSNSRIEEFETNISYDYGSGIDLVNTNGTFVVTQTSGDASASLPTYIYTTQTGLQEVFIGDCVVWNNITNFDRTGLSSEYQVLEKLNVNREFIGIYLVSKSGISEFKDLTSLLQSDPHSVNKIVVGTEIISILLDGISPSRIIAEEFNFGTNITSLSLVPGTYTNLEVPGKIGTGLLLNVVVATTGINIFSIIGQVVNVGENYTKGESIQISFDKLGGSVEESINYTLEGQDISEASSYTRLITLNKNTLSLQSNERFNDKVTIEICNDRILSTSEVLDGNKIIFLDETNKIELDPLSRSYKTKNDFSRDKISDPV